MLKLRHLMTKILDIASIIMYYLSITYDFKSITVDIEVNMTYQDTGFQQENALSYREKSLIVATIISIVVYAIYGVVLFQRYQAGGYEAADAFQFWGKAVLVLMGVLIAFQIIGQILLAIAANVAAAATGQEFDEDEVSFDDERDKLIDLKATRNTFIVWGVGFMGAMVGLAFGMSPTTMFIIFIVFMMLADILGNVSKLVYYRRGF